MENQQKSRGKNVNLTESNPNSNSSNSKRQNQTSLAESESLEILGSKWNFSKVGEIFVMPYQKPRNTNDSKTEN